MRARISVVCLMLLGASLPLHAADFACYVTFPTVAPSIALIETDTVANAVRIAAGTHSKGPVRQRERVKEVVECILRLTERFSDPAAQRLLDKLPI
jgi:hypothetical protein